MLKKVSLFFVALACAFAVNAQDQTFKKFKVGMGTGYAMPGGTGAKAGVLFYFEPAYRIQDNLLVGARFEFAAMVRGYASDAGTVSADVNFAGSNSLFGQYYFSNNSFRPYAGLGLGLFSVAAGGGSNDPNDPEAYLSVDESKFGVFPRIGFDLGHFNMGIDYNIIGKSTVKNQAGTNEINTKNSYLGIHLGFFFGGGRM